MNKNKFEASKKYFTISIYVIVVVFICTIGIISLANWSNTTKTFSSIFKKASPFLAGAFAAYIISPMVRKLEINFFMKRLKIKRQKLCRFLGILTSYVLVLGLIFLFFIYIIPQLASSIYELVLALPSVEDITKWLESMEQTYPGLAIPYLEENISNVLPALLSKLSSILTDIIPLLYNASLSVVQLVLNTLIAIMISCYVLSDTSILKKNFKRACYAFLPEKKCDSFMATLKDCDHIFGGFIIGKIIDSLIIGSLCLIILSIFKFPFAMLISVIVGLTNMIPYFGPFIGAIPGFFIILIVNPKQAFIFLVIILILQQFDGLYLGPKILGDSTGLRPLWIITSITVGGWIAGPLGMFLGVPVFAVLTFLLDKLIRRKLAEKNLLIEEPAEETNDVVNTKPNDNTDK